MAYQPQGRSGGYQGRPDHRRENAPQRPPEPPVVRPKSYAGPGKSYPRPELVDTEARAEAELWVNRGVKTTQMRRFFGTVMSDLRRFDLKDRTDDAEAQLAMMMLKANAHYAKGRARDLACIADFFDHHAGLVKTLADFRYFARHFEAIVAYHKALDKSDGGSRDD